MNNSFIFFFFTSIFASHFLSALSQPRNLGFRCTGPATCTSLIDYVSPNATTLSAIAALFTLNTTASFSSLLGANNLSFFTPRNFPIAARQTVQIPFPCNCSAGIGLSNRNIPVYTVVPGDGLYHIAAEVFSNVVTFQQIQQANEIRDANTIEVGQRVWVPLPCSCDEVEGEKVVHYGHVVANGSSVEEIGRRYNVSEGVLMRLNNLSNAQDLRAAEVLDVPLRACSSSVQNTSLDHPLLVPNGTSVITARNCVTCKCDAAVSWTLQCQPVRNSSCSPIRCEGAPDNLLNLGNTTTSGCNRTACAYAGYNQTTVLATLATESTCPAPTGSSASSLQGEKTGPVLLIFIHLPLLLSVYFLN